MKWIIILWILTVEWPLGGPIQYGVWYNSQAECYSSLLHYRFEIINKMQVQYPASRVDDMDCMSSEWYESNVIIPKFEVPELTGNPKDGHSSLSFKGV